jgi:hypothetical protein
VLCALALSELQEVALSWLTPEKTYKVWPVTSLADGQHLALSHICPPVQYLDLAY